MAADEVAAFRDHLSGLYPFTSSASGAPYYALATLWHATDSAVLSTLGGEAAPVTPAVPPSLIPMILRLCLRPMLDVRDASPLHAAVHDRNRAVFDEAVRLGVVDETHPTKELHTIHHAALGGFLYGVHSMMGAFRDRVDRTNLTVLHAAAMSDDPGTFDWVLAVRPGAIASRNKWNRLPLHVACTYGSFETLEAVLRATLEEGLERAVYAEDVLQAVAASGSLPKLDLILGVTKDRVDPTFVNSSGTGAYTIAHAACEGDSVPVVERCVALFGGWTSVPQGSGHNGTLLNCAARSDSIAMFDYVAARTRGMSAPPGGYTPLHAAIICGSSLTVQRLIRRGYDINASTTSGTSSVYLAARSGSIELVRLVLRELDPATPRHTPGLAVSLAHQGAVNMLAECAKLGVCKMSERSQGLAVVHAAVLSEKLEMLHFCLDNGGGTLDETTDSGRTVVDVAKLTQNTRLIEEVERRRADAASRNDHA